MSDSWNANLYSQFLDLRTRPARDLLSVIPDSFHPKSVYDLGCGPGNSTALLKFRWPHTKLIGLDSSLDMLKEARKNYPDITFIEGDIANFSLKEKTDCLFANASLQWLDDHPILLPKLSTFLKPDGLLAIQMPNNFHEPTHQITIKILEAHPAWRSLLKNLRYGLLTQPLYSPAWYYDILTQAQLENIQCWETTYFQEMNDYQAFFEWGKGTALRPILSQMNQEEQHSFETAYLNAIKHYYPLQINKKILLPFRRIFMVGWLISSKV